MAAAESALQQEVRSLYSDHHGWLQGWLRRRLGNAFDAADLAHDVFIRLLARREPVAMKEPRAYLSSVARGLVIDHWRRRWRCSHALRACGGSRLRLAPVHDLSIMKQNVPLSCPEVDEPLRNRLALG